MKRNRPYYAVFLSLSLLFLVSGAAAQGNSTVDDSSSKTVLKELDNATWISNVEWDPENASGQIRVDIYSEIPKQITVQEIPDYTGTSGDFAPREPITIQEGLNEIFVPVNGRINFGVAVTDSNNGTYYRKSFFDFFPNVGIPLLFFSGFVGFILTIVAEYWYVKKATEKVEKGSGRLI